MTIKHADSVESYTAAAVQIQGMLRNLLEWAETLPAPDESGNLHGVDYADLMLVLYVCGNVEEISRFIDESTKATR